MLLILKSSQKIPTFINFFNDSQIRSINESKIKKKANTRKNSISMRLDTNDNDNEEKDFVFILKQLSAKKSKQLLKIFIVPTTLFVNGDPKFLLYNEKVLINLIIISINFKYL